ncbi:MAG TPA: OBAP family protein [Microlunatus sp.]|nr:OBAP family protein [Microlunatus sp.]
MTIPRSTRLATPKAVLVGAAAGLASAFAWQVGRKAVTLATIGRGHPLKHRVLDIASAVLQQHRPVEAMSTFLNGFHFYADDLGRPVEASHFCMHLRHDLHQCVIFDRNAPDARLIGIEYIISEERYRDLPEDEKRLWHSHHYEVSSGTLTAPGVPDWAEHSYFADLVTTYGKTFHHWQYDRDDFPYGIPQLMMGFTADGQLDQTLVEDRDRRFGISSADKKRRRADIPTPTLVPGANSWESGRVVQTRLVETDVAHPAAGTGGAP